MVDLFAQCDPDYGRRVAEGLEMAAEKNIQKGSIGSAHSEDAVQQAEKKSHEAKPY